MRHYRLCLLGFGNVGKALAQIIVERGEFLRSKHQLDLTITAVADSKGAVVSEAALDLPLLLQTVEREKTVTAYPQYGRKGLSALELVKVCQADIVVELTPTSITDGEPALSHILTAFDRGMHVVTANKGPVVAAYRRIIEAAESSDRMFKFGGATAGALPTVNVGVYDLAGCDIQAIEGIPNGTTNFILTRMTEQGVTFAEALAEAQRLGIAETNPSLDVDGYDTANKLVILAYALLDAKIGLQYVKRTGISGVTPEMIALARSEGKVIKLLGRAAKSDNGVEITVAPTAIPLSHPLASVNGTEKAITFTTDLMGKLTISGGNSGRIPAAAAVLRDLINLAREDRG
ncbi:MAG: homoserine dehydrogenase [Bacillota bacterium]